MTRRTTLSLLILSLSAQAETVSHWRFDEDSATAGASIVTAENFASPGTHDAAPNGGETLYSDDVPFAEVFDPVNGETYTNAFSFEASAAQSQLLVPNSASFDSSFTLEFFVKMIGEPSSYESIFDRLEASDLSWKIDFDHAAATGFGRIRTRWDTPAGGVSDGVAERDIDENWNFVLGPLGKAAAPKIFIDTGAKDEFGADVGPQNTGNPNDYLYDAASLNPNELDVALQGDGTNDVLEWHHVALTFNEDTGEIRFYFDYALTQTRILADTENNGYTHPSADLRFGKLSGTPYGLLMDEVRFSDEVLSNSSFLRAPATGGGNTIGYWRMEDDDAADGGDIFEVSNEISALHSALTNNGTPKYSADVPASNIFDPVSDTTYPNSFSMDASDPKSRLSVPADDALNTSFSLEFFMKLPGEPNGYHAFFRRSEMNDLRWQIDFDHGSKSGFGRLRTRFDTPGPDGPDGVNEAGVDENINFVLGPQGGASIPDALRLWLDTPTGDGMASSYTGADWFDDGDSTNDNNVWHHAAITFDEETGAINFYFDYELVQSRNLSDSLMDGYTHPNGAILFGKLANADYALLLDEVRYSGEVLQSFQFLQAVTVPEAELAITNIVFDPDTPSSTVTWNTTLGKKYSLDHSADLILWLEVLEEEEATGETLSFTDEDLRGGSGNVFYRVREIE